MNEQLFSFISWQLNKRIGAKAIFESLNVRLITMAAKHEINTMIESRN